MATDWRGCSWRPCCSCRPCDASARAAAQRAAARAAGAAWEVNGAESASLGQASQPHRSLPLGPERLSHSSRVCSAARSLENRAQEVRGVSCGTREAASTSCPAGSRRPRAQRRRATPRDTHPPSGERRPPPRVAAPRRAEVPCGQRPRHAPISSGWHAATARGPKSPSAAVAPPPLDPWPVRLGPWRPGLRPVPGRALVAFHRGTSTYAACMVPPCRP